MDKEYEPWTTAGLGSHGPMAMEAIELGLSPLQAPGLRCVARRRGRRT
jgi:hypothetical protein